MSQPNREAEIAETELNHEWDGYEWVDLPKLTAKDLDLILSAYDRKAKHYRAEQICRPDPYNIKMLKKIDNMVCAVLARYHNQERI